MHVVLDYASLCSLGKTIGIPAFLELLGRPSFSATYCDEIIATFTKTVGSVQYHDFVTVEGIVNQEKRKVIKNMTERFQFVLEKGIGLDRSEARKYATKLRTLLPIKKYSGNDFVDGGVLVAAREDLGNPAFVCEAINLAMRDMVRGNLPAFRFEVRKYDEGWVVDTNLKFPIQKERIRAEHIDELQPAHLLDTILLARADLAVAAHYGGELHTWQLTSNLVRLRYAELLKRIGIEKDALGAFMEIVVPEGKAIREVINSGDRTFDEFLVVLDKSTKFREWIRGVNPDEKLVAAYLRDVTAQGWINSLPSKAIRYALTLVGLIEPITGLTVSAADSFLLERMVGGWRPNHFVDARLKPFVGDA